MPQSYYYKKRITQDQHLLGLCMLAGLFFPHFYTPLMLINPLMCVFLAYYYRNKVSRKPYSMMVFFVCSVILISVMAAVASGYHASSKYLLTAVSILLMFVLFPFAGSTKIPRVYYYIAIGFILFSQLVYLFNLPFFEGLFDYFYPVRGSDERLVNYMKTHISYGSILDFRLGGLFRNPNQAARFVTAITAVYLIDHRSETNRNTIYFLLLSGFSVLLTGSRTGFVIFALIVLLFYIAPGQLSRTTKYLLLLGGSIPVVIALMSLDLSGMRGLNVERGFQDSIGLKIEVFIDYLLQPNSFFHLVFGYGDIDTFMPSSYTMLDNFDSEIGDVVYTYGFLGFLAVIMFYVRCFRMTGKRNRLFYVLLLWSVSSTLLFSYRMSFLLMLFLSHVVSLGESQDKQVNG